MGEHTDVIVVGAGPAGSTAAAVLARQGVRVLLLDREHFPRDKACGDVVPAGCFRQLQAIGLSTQTYDCFPIDRVVLAGSQAPRREFRLSRHGDLSTCVVSRRLFDQALFDYALACGAQFRRCSVKELRYKGAAVCGVTGTDGRTSRSYEGAVVIGADGATSAVARGLGRRSAPGSQWAVACRGYVSTAAALDGAIELAFLDHLQPGYAWFFPIGSHRANVGVGMRSDFYKRQNRSLERLLSDYLARPEIAGRLGSNYLEETKSWSLPLFTYEQRRVFPGALLAGDAGGFVHPITAAGIYPAILTGKCAAEATVRALQAGDLSQAGLAHYDTLWQAELAAELKPAVTASKLSTLFPHIISAALLVSPAAAKAQTDDPPAFPFATGKF